MTFLKRTKPREGGGEVEVEVEVEIGKRRRETVEANLVAREGVKV